MRAQTNTRTVGGAAKGADHPGAAHALLDLDVPLLQLAGHQLGRLDLLEGKLRVSMQPPPCFNDLGAQGLDGRVDGEGSVRRHPFLGSILGPAMSAGPGSIGTLKEKGFSEEKIAELQSAFSMFDQAGTGFITAGELRSLYSSLGAHRRALPAAAGGRERFLSRASPLDTVAQVVSSRRTTWTTWSAS